MTAHRPPSTAMTSETGEMQHQEVPAFDYAEDEDTETSIAVWLHPGDFPPAQANLTCRAIRDEGADIAKVWSPGKFG